MVIVIRALQAILMFFAFGATVTAFVVGVLVVDASDGCLLAPESSTSRLCARSQAKGAGAIGIGVAGVAAALVAVAFNGMVRPKPQVQPTPGGRPQPSGAFPMPPPYGPPR